jgi:hypothetical protein
VTVSGPRVDLVADLDDALLLLPVRDRRELLEAGFGPEKPESGLWDVQLGCDISPIPATWAALHPLRSKEDRHA